MSAALARANLSTSTGTAGQPSGHPTREEATHAAWQVGVMTRQTAALAYGRSRVSVQLSARRWQAPTPGVIVTHNGPLTRDQLIWVALLSGPTGTLLHGLSGAQYDGLRGFDPDRLTLVVPGSSRNCAARLSVLAQKHGVGIRWSTKLGEQDVNPHSTPPRARLARSLVDAASERVSKRRARVILLAGVQQRLVRTPALADALSRRGKCRNRAIIVESILDAAGGIQSLPEADLNTIRRRLRLPEPRRQVTLRRQDGRYFLDNEWPEFGVRVEVHGIPHYQVRNWDSDLLRQNDIAIEGGGLLLFSSYATRHLQAQVGEQLVRMLRRRGWSG